MDMREKVRSFMEQYHMTAPGDLIIAGVSGGADSVCLLLVLSELSDSLGVELAAVHVNHQLRDEAGDDEAYVKELCGQLGVPLTVFREDIKALAGKNHISCEEAGREARYRAFEKAGADRLLEKAVPGRRPDGLRIAVAHHQDDRAETMLFHLFRGTGISGMAGIRPVRDRVIRPLLCVTRDEIERYLKTRGIRYCTDATNAQDTYTRNKIRLHILPYAEREICAGSVRHMNEAADIFLETEQYLSEAAKEAFERCAGGQDSDNVVISCRKLREEKPLIQKRVLLLALEKLTPHRKDIGLKHVESLLRLSGTSGCKSVSLPGGLTAQKEYDRLILKRAVCVSRSDASGEENGLYETVGSLPAAIPLGDGRTLLLEAVSREKSEIIPQKPYTKWFDYDKIKKSMVIRTRRTGDYLTVDSRLSKKTLKAYMIDQKIPQRLRDQLPLLAEGNHILWIIDGRISEYYKVSEHTKHILKVQLKEENCPSEKRKEPGDG